MKGLMIGIIPIYWEEISKDSKYKWENLYQEVTNPKLNSRT